jgi:hypothetical protein
MIILHESGRPEAERAVLKSPINNAARNALELYLAMTLIGAMATLQNVIFARL